MRKINKYINQVYKDFDGSKEEIRELKEEMRIHLVENVEELKKQGHSEDAAIRISLKNFGEETDINLDLAYIFTPKRVYFKPLIQFGISCLIIGIITLCIFIVAQTKQNDNFDAFLEDIRFEISKYDSTNSKEVSTGFAHALDNKVNNFQSYSEWYKTTLTHLNIYLVDIPDDYDTDIQKGPPNYSWGQRVSTEKTTHLFYGNDLFGLIEIQMNSSKWEYYLPIIFFTLFAILTILYYLINHLYHKRKIQLRNLLQRIIIAIITAIILSITVSLVNFFTYNEFIVSYFILYVILAILVLILFGVPISYLIEKWTDSTNAHFKFSHYLKNVLLYALFGSIGGYCFVLLVYISSYNTYGFWLNELIRYIAFGSFAAIIGYHLLLITNKLIKIND